ncbi:hypothetical protein [uncultured Sulfitobacter sp.]|uniref:hypothetical protein n=1 Tax=uncultured Sulfitobacter sp. TaxID=191468 RepID=UPI0026101AE1|nr:hypothetical protein [uncultured Sulfitobacter sp.]
MKDATAEFVGTFASVPHPEEEGTMEAFRYSAMATFLNIKLDHPDVVEGIARAGMARLFLKQTLELAGSLPWMEANVHYAYKFAVDMADSYIDDIIARGELPDGDTPLSDLGATIADLVPIRFVAHFANNPAHDKAGFQKRLERAARLDGGDFVLSGWLKTPLPLPEYDAILKCA